MRWSMRTRHMSARLDTQASIRDGIVALSGSVRICGRQNAYKRHSRRHESCRLYVDLKSRDILTSSQGFFRRKL
jgi:hypothetical protein